MLILTSCSLIYILKSKKRIKTVENFCIFVCLILAYIAESCLAILDLKTRGNADKNVAAKDILFAL